MIERIETLISTKAIEKRIDEMAEQISKDFEGETIELICILKGSVMFMVELAKRLTVPVKMHFMSVSSYGDDVQSWGEIKIKMDLDEPIEEKHVLVVEDIIDSGRTLRRLVELLEFRKPKTLRLCTLLDKPDRRVAVVKTDYTGFKIPDAFVVGYGLDYAQRYRNLDYIGVISFIEE